MTSSLDSIAHVEQSNRKFGEEVGALNTIMGNIRDQIGEITHLIRLLDFEVTKQESTQ